MSITLLDSFLKDMKESVAQVGYNESVAGYSEKNISYNVSSKVQNGDVCFPLFAISKAIKKSPKDIADLINSSLKNPNVEKTEFVNGYLNVFFKKNEFYKQILQDVLNTNYEKPLLNLFNNDVIAIEFSSPNTNKPLHLGHLRNDILGESLSRILKFAGANVKKLNLVNDRGIHICKSMYAYKKSFDGKTPEDFNEKSDKFVGRCYVEYSKLERDNPDIVKAEIEEMLRKWEAGDSETLALWKKLGDYAINGIKQTYELTGISFDKYYLESEHYLVGKDEVYRGLNEGIFYKAENGSVCVNLEDEGLDIKVLLRADGTSIYITQDIALITNRQKELNFQRHIYVVGSEQNHHFKVLFAIIKKLGYDWAKNLYHLSYGMVNLPDGKMKSREGTVVDADNLVYEVRDLVREQMKDSDIPNKEEVMLKVALGSIHYYLLQVSSSKDMMFDKQSSISFNGNTGAYLQYTCARISSIFEKLSKDELVIDTQQGIDFSSLTSEDEWSLLINLMNFKSVVQSSATDYNPSLIANYSYSLAHSFSGFYTSSPIKSLESGDLKKSRILLTMATEKVLKQCLYLMNIPYVSKM